MRCLPISPHSIGRCRSPAARSRRSRRRFEHSGAIDMTRFGLRTTGPATPSAAAPSFPLHLILAAFAVPAALTAAYIWFYVLKMPLDRPVGPLVRTAPANREGWAAWYVAPPFAFALAYAVFWLYFRKAHRRTLIGFAGSGGAGVGGRAPALLRARQQRLP